MVNFAILGLIGVIVYLITRRPAGAVPQGTEPSVVTVDPGKKEPADTSGKVVAVDGNNNPVVLDPVSKNYSPPPVADPKVPSSLPRGNVPATPEGTGEVPSTLLPERTPAVPTGDPVVQPEIIAGRRVVTTSESNAYRAEKDGIAVYEPDQYKGMRSFFLTNNPGSWMHNKESRDIYKLMYGEAYDAKLELLGKVAENMNPQFVVPHRTIRPPDRRAQFFIYDGSGNEVIYDEHLQDVVWPAA